MQIKQFTGSSVDEILKQIRAELGDDAVIIQTRRIVRGGIGGFFGREMIEVTAAEGVEDEAGREQLNRAAARAVLDVHDDEDDLPNPFARHLQHRMSAATEAETDPRMYDGPAASPAGVYARNAQAAEPEDRPFAPGGPERTQAIIDAARDAMRQARAAREEQSAVAEPPARTATGLPDPPQFIPATRPAARTAGGMNVVPDADDPAVALPVWERVETARPSLPRAAASPAEYAEQVAARFEAPAAYAPQADEAYLDDLDEEPGPAAPPRRRAEAAPAPSRRAAPRRAAAPPPPPAIEDDEEDLEDLPAMEDEAVAIAEEPIAPAPARAGSRQVVVSAAEPAAGPAKALEAVRGELLGAGVDARYLDPFLDGFARTCLPFSDGDALRDSVRGWFASRLPVPREWKGRPAGHMLAFVGQSGVGKSTVVSKLAWRLHAAGQSVAVICAGGSPDPTLEAVTQRLGLALAIAEDGDAVAQARAELAGHDAILVDTPGRSHKNLGDMEELGRLLTPCKAEEVHLVLPVAVHLADLGDVSRRFRLAGVNRLTLTKLDETRFLGNLVNVPLRMAKPLAFLADGPGVPGDLSPADPVRVAELLLP
ncbi:MAG: hypothetical protein IT200_17685 [Thermoleophilia bacterium]|nr:hypothetical protein [Thermoleophilia bacterium]